MSTTTVERISGYCPEINDNKSINVDFIEVKASGTTYTKIKGRFECDKSNFDNCEYYNKNGNCPIYNNIPNEKK